MNPALLAVVSDTVLLALIALVGGACTGLVTPVLMFILKDRADRAARAEDRAYQLELAKINREEAGKREGRIVREVQQVKAVAITGVKSAKDAYHAANNVNEKIASLGQQLVDDKSTPQQVEIMNTPDHPVPVETHPHE